MRWPVLPLARLCQIETGRTPSRARPEYFGGGNVWVTIADLNDEIICESKEHITDDAISKARMRPVKPGTVLLSYKLSLGKLGIAGTSLFTNEAIAALSPHQGVELVAKYLFYALRTVDYLSLCHGAVKGKCLNRASLSRIPVPYPSLSEQHRIVEILDQADALRKKRAEADAKAARILPSLFYKMFGDPATNPKGWDTANLGDVILETQYGTSTKANASGDGLPVLRMNNIDSDGYLDLSDIKYVKLSIQENKKYALANGDILFNRTNSKELVGKTGMWRGEMQAVAASYLIRVRVNQERAIPIFIWAYMNCPFIKQMLLNRCRRAIGMANINAKELRNLPLIIPPKNRQMEFSNHLDGLEVLRNQWKQRTKAIDRIFDTLLHRAFAGDLTAKWREAHMNELLAEMEAQAKVLIQKSGL